MTRRRRQVTNFREAVVRHTAEVLRAAGIPDAEGRAHGDEVARRLCHEYGKSQMYVPSTQTWDVTERDERLYEAYTSRSAAGTPPFTQQRVEEVADEFKITTSYVYQVVSLVRARMQQDRQPTLPGLDQPA
jgi:Mor family transcriptional regulator